MPEQARGADADTDEEIRSDPARGRLPDETQERRHPHGAEDQADEPATARSPSPTARLRADLALRASLVDGPTADRVEDLDAAEEQDRRDRQQERILRDYPPPGTRPRGARHRRRGHPAEEAPVNTVGAEVGDRGRGGGDAKRWRRSLRRPPQGRRRGGRSRPGAGCCRGRANEPAREGRRGSTTRRLQPLRQGQRGAALAGAAGLPEGLGHALLGVGATSQDEEQVGEPVEVGERGRVGLAADAEASRSARRQTVGRGRGATCRPVPPGRTSCATARAGSSRRRRPASSASTCEGATRSLSLPRTLARTGLRRGRRARSARARAAPEPRGEVTGERDPPITAFSSSTAPYASSPVRRSWGRVSRPPGSSRRRRPRACRCAEANRLVALPHSAVPYGAVTRGTLTDDRA